MSRNAQQLSYLRVQRGQPCVVARRQPPLQPLLAADDLSGHIELKDAHFTYPTEKQKPVWCCEGVVGAPAPLAPSEWEGAANNASPHV